MPTPLPRIMVAPNGARRGKADHPALPVTIDELVTTAVACHRAGADGLHMHVRDGEARHSLDVGLYREALAALGAAVPDMFLQVTSEAAGRYGPEAQMQMIRDLRPASVSLAPSELMRPPTDRPMAQSFYGWAEANGVSIHHIVYSPEQLDRFFHYVKDGIIPGAAHQLQLVLGSYGGAEPSRPEDLDGFTALLSERAGDLALDWMVCAFGSGETDCLVAAARHGGKMRIGFENSLWHGDGSVATDNAERVRALVSALEVARM